MLIHFTISSLKETRWYQFAIRFALGGLVTAGAGLIAKYAGPSFGGIFLAFPAILAASVTLVAKHTQEEKEELGQNGTFRGKHAAGADAAGAAMGSVGLFTFAMIVSIFLPKHRSLTVIAAATFAWAVVSALVWWCWKRHYLRRFILHRRKFRQSQEAGQ